MAIVFFYPTINGKLGGAQKLIITIAEELCSRGNDVKIIDHSSGYCAMFKHQLPNVDFQFFTSERELNGVLKELSLSDTLILFNTMYVSIRKYTCINCRILYWDLLYTNFRTLFTTRVADIPFVSKLDRVKLFNELSARDALITTDPLGKKWIRDACGKDIPIVQLPVKRAMNLPILTKLGSKNKHSITYVGRACDWKVRPIAKIVEDLIKYELKVTLNIYTDDVLLFKILMKEYLNQDQFDFFVKIVVLHENIPMNQIFEFSKNDIIHMGMGTVAIEFAFQGYFTINLDYSSNKFPDNYAYRYMYPKEDELCVSQNLDFILEADYLENGHSLLDVYNSALDEELRSHIIHQSYDYVLQHHSVSSVVDAFLASVNKSQLFSQHYFSFLRGLISVKMLDFKLYLIKLMKT